MLASELQKISANREVSRRTHFTLLIIQYKTSLLADVMVVLITELVLFGALSGDVFRGFVVV